MASSDEVLVEEKSCARVLVLNRPKQLNAVSAVMVSRLLELFHDCVENPSVKLIILKGKGRAFCAGADVAKVVGDITRGNWKSSVDYFRKVYTLMYFIATYNKPQVSFLDGIVMGVGAGLSTLGRFRVATENSLIAMPETSMGIVGACYILSRLPGCFGEYVGLTGARFDGADMLACGLATHFVQSQIGSFRRCTCNDAAVISSTIEQFSHSPNLNNNSAYRRLEVINKCFSKRTVEEIIAALAGEDEWISSTIHSLNKASPISLKISLRSIREGRVEDIGKCIIREYRILWHVMRGEVSKDFVEGCRALLLDKDKNPKWEPSNLESVSSKMLDSYFAEVDDDDWEDLKLAVSSKPAYAIAKL